MRSVVDSAGNSTVLYPDDESDVIAKLASVRVPGLVGSDSTEQAGQRLRCEIRGSLENTIIEFSDAQELQAVDISAGFASVNKSVIYYGIPSQVVEEQFKVGIEGWFSSGLQRWCAYNLTAKLVPARVPGFIESDTAKQLWQWPRDVESARVLGLIGSDATEQAGQRLRYEIPGSFEDATIEFSDAWGSQIRDISAGFASVNKSVVYDGILSQVVEEQLGRLLSIAHEEQFEVGIESQLSRSLQQLCAYDPASALRSLRVKLMDNDARSEVLAEILRWASRQEAVAIRDLVVDLLSTGLHHTASLVRDAAALGLAYLDEEAAIVPLRYALEREKVPELREDLEDLIRSLENWPS